MKKALLSAILGASMTAGIAPQAAAEADYILATASTGGTYYPVRCHQHPDQGEAATETKNRYVGHQLSGLGRKPTFDS